MSAGRARGQEPSELERLLEETRQALAFGHAHVVLIAEGDLSHELPARLTEALGGQVHAVTLRLDTAGSQDATADLEDRIREAREDAARALPPIDPLAPGPPDAAGLVLIVPAALALPVSVLRSLDEATTRGGEGERLVLLVDRSESAFRDPARELAARLGVGLAKVDRGERGSRSREAPERPSLPQPPVVASPRRRRSRPIPVRAYRPAPRGLRVVHLGLAAIGLATAVAAAPALLRHTRDAAATTEPPRAVAVSIAPRDAAPSAPAQAAAAPALPPVGLPRPHETPAPPKAVEKEPAASAPAISIGVNFNANPWARLEVDGRDIGPTPVSQVPLSPGPHRVRARFPDGRVVERQIRVDALRNRFRIE